MIVSLIMSVFWTYMSTTYISSLPVYNHDVTCFARIWEMTDITYVSTHIRHIFIVYPAAFRIWGKKKKRNLAVTSFCSVFDTSSNCTFTSICQIFLHCFKTFKIFFFIIFIATMPKCHHHLIGVKESLVRTYFKTLEGTYFKTLE